MRSDSATFLARIREVPGADLPRLVYADWLDEDGQPEQAELIRAHIEYDNLSDDCPQRRELAAVCHRLLREPEVVVPQPLRAFRYRFNRGLVESVEFSDATGETIAAAFQAAPLRQVRFFGLAGYQQVVHEIAGESCLKMLDLTGNVLTASDLHFILDSLRFPHLEDLVLCGCGLTDGTIPTLREFARSRSRIRLHLGGNPFSVNARWPLRRELGHQGVFECERTADSLYNFRNGRAGHMVVGVGDNLTQHLLADLPERILLAEFDLLGTPIRVAQYRLPSPNRHEFRTELLAKLSHTPADIRVQRFRFPFGEGIYDYDDGWLAELDNPMSTEMSRRWLTRWLQNGAFCFWWSEDGADWFHRNGFVTHT